MTSSGGGIRYGPDWELRSANGPSVHLWRRQDTGMYRLGLIEKGGSPSLLAELTLTELIGLREWIGVEARRRTQEARG